MFSQPGFDHAAEGVYSTQRTNACSHPSYMRLKTRTRVLRSLWTSDRCCRCSARRSGKLGSISALASRHNVRNTSRNTNRFLNQSWLELISGSIAPKWSFCPVIKWGWRVKMRNSYWLMVPLSAPTPIITRCNLMGSRAVQGADGFFFPFLNTFSLMCCWVLCSEMFISSLVGRKRASRPTLNSWLITLTSSSE